MRMISILLPIFSLSCRETKEVELPTPQLQEVVIDQDDVFTDTVLICTAIVEEEGTLFYSYRWMNGDVEIGATDQITLDSSIVQPNDEIKCTVTVRNSYDISTTSSATRTIQNTPPVINSVFISPNANVRINDTLTCLAEASDVDTTELSITYSWMFGDVLLTDGDRIDLGDFSVTESSEIACVVAVEDPQGAIIQEEKVVDFLNTPPVIQQVQITPDPASVDSTLSCAAQYIQNPNEAQYTFSYEWERNGSPLGLDPDIDELQPPHNVHDVVACTVIINDGTQDGVPVRSEIQIVNDLPVITSVTVSPQSAYVDSTLVCNGTGEDPNHIDLSSSYRWTNQDGAIISTSNIVSLAPSVVSTGDVLTCTYTLLDPVGGEAQDSTSITIENTPPQIDLVSLSSASAYVGDTVTCSGQAQDINGDSLSWTYRWLNAQGVELETQASLILTADNTDRDQLLFCEATVTDQEYFVTRQGSVFIANSPPTISSISVTPDPGTSYENYHCDVQMDDPDVDSLSLLYTWTIDGIPQSITGDTLYHPFDVGSLIMCEAVADDGELQSTPKQITTFVQNTVPNISSIEITPGEPIQNSLLSCSAVAEDLDINSLQWETDINLLYQWTDSDGTIISNQPLLQLYASFASSGDVFTCTATAMDPQGGTSSSTAEITLVNSQPTFTETVSISASFGLVGDTLSCSAVAEDAQDGELDISYEWSNQDGTILGTENSLILDENNIEPDDIVTCAVMAEDSLGEMISASTSIPIQNTPPEIQGLSITPTTVYSDTVGVSCVPGPSSDANNETVSISYAWFKDGVRLPNTTEDLITSFQTESILSCTATPNDGREDGDVYTASVQVSNHDPVFTSVLITPSTDIFVGETLSCTSSANDLDGHSLNTTYRWVDEAGTLLSADSTLTLTSATTYPGDLHCYAVVDDGFGGIVESVATVEVQNSAPEWIEQASLALTDKDGDSTNTAFSEGTATCSAQASDDDDGELSVAYSWRIAGEEVATGSSWTIDANLSNVGDTLICMASATDTYGETITSTTSVTISNTLPVVSVSIEPTTATVVDTLLCSVTALDPDVQELAYTYSWERNGLDEPSWLNLESISGTFSKLDDIKCTVTPNDGINFGDPISGSIIISNALPVVDTIEFVESDVYTDSTIQVVVTGSDSDQESVIFEYDWYRISAQTGATELVQSGSIDSLDSSFFDKEDTIYVEAFADDGSEKGPGTTSSELTVLNTPPLPPEISISPSLPLVDQSLVCSVDTSSLDIDSDPSTYTVTWTKNTNPFADTQTTTIAGDTISSSDLVVTDHWVCTVTPNDGTDDGEASQSYVTIGGGDVFDGTFGTSWETLETAPSNVFSLMTYMSGDFPYLWNASGDYLSYYDPGEDSWEYITNVTPYDGIMKSMAPIQDMLYMIRNESIYRFDPNTETWTTLGTYSGGDDLNQTTSDYQGHVYGYASSGSIIEYDIISGSVQEYATGLGSLYETRIAYDPTEESLYFGAYNDEKLYQYDLNTQILTEKTAIPEAPLNTIFCGDRSGHLYVAGGYFGQTMWQYTMSTDSWAELPNLIIDHGNNGSCSVSEEGYLYVGFGSLLRLHRISLGLQ